MGTKTDVLGSGTAHQSTLSEPVISQGNRPLTSLSGRSVSLHIVVRRFRLEAFDPADAYPAPPKEVSSIALVETHTVTCRRSRSLERLLLFTMSQ
jgi:hypothetical protein